MDRVVLSKKCKNCGNNFDITERDTVFYEKVKVPEPTFCHDCRQQRKLAQVNQMNLFKRICPMTGKEIVSNYPPDGPYVVYEQHYWFSDKYDGVKYGRDFDFSRPFFEQFEELAMVVPRRPLFADYPRDENSAYTNNAGKNKDCYMIFDSDENRECMYSFGINGSRSSMDNYRVQNLELCYEVMDSKDCYNCSFVYNSQTCSDSYFLNNCIGCKHCIYCSNLNQKEYFIFNQPGTKEQYEEIAKSFGSYSFLMDKKEKFQEFRLHFPNKYLKGFQYENCSGNYLVNCKDAEICFDSANLWTGKYCNQIFIQGKDCMDLQECGECELMYECTGVGYNSYNMKFCMFCMNEISDMEYCHLCFNSSHLFGCIGLKRNKFCILNKQYTEEEYHAIKERIINHMKNTGEYGEFFPAKYSSFPYNLSVAQDWYPLTKEEALAKGYKWRDPDKKEYQKSNYEIPDSIDEVPKTITQKVLACADCGRNYKIGEPEYMFYIKKNLPLPRKCFHCRHNDRFKLRPGRKLFDKNCGKCGTEILTAYSPEMPDIVYCEKCYLDSLT